jgi:hypothetical protein
MSKNKTTIENPTKEELDKNLEEVIAYLRSGGTYIMITTEETEEGSQVKTSVSLKAGIRTIMALDESLDSVRQELRKNVVEGFVKNFTRGDN